MAKWLDDLNDPQRLAVTHGDGPLLVIAGAGTGKTRTLACRVAFLIEQGIAPNHILLLTFTRRAAVEMVSRAGRYTGRGSAGKVWGGAPFTRWPIPCCASTDGRSGLNLTSP